MLPNWLLGKSKSKLQEILGGGGGGTSYTAGDGIDISDSVISLYPATTPAIDSSKIDGLSDDLDSKAALTQITNPNLLDNPWFTVNQRGAISYNTNGYTVDRWKGEDLSDSGNTISISNDGLVCTSSGTPSKSTYIRQYFNGSVFDGSTFTVSMIIESSVAIKTYLQVKSSDNTNLIDSSGIDIPANTPTVIKASAEVQKVDGICSICAFFNYTKEADAIVKIKAIKLEKGSVSTLAMDVVPDYTIELIKCQHYFQVFTGDLGRAMTVLAYRIQFNVTLPIRLYSSPTVTGTPRIFNLDTTEVTGFTFSYSAINNYQTLRINADKTAHGLTDAYVNAGTQKLYISAEL